MIVPFVSWKPKPENQFRIHVLVCLLQRFKKKSVIENPPSHNANSHNKKKLEQLSKAHLLPKSTGNTQEAVAPSQYD